MGITATARTTSAFSLSGIVSRQGHDRTRPEIFGAFKGKRVAVVGFGKSAVDMADFAVQQQQKAGVSCLPHSEMDVSPAIVRRTLPHYFFNRFGSMMMPSWLHPSAVERMMHLRTPGFVRSFWKMIEGLLRGKIMKRGAKLGPDIQQRLRCLIPDPPAFLLRRAGQVIILFVAAGRIAPHHEIAAFTPKGILLQNGVTMDCDVVMLLLGNSTPSFPFLPAEYRAMLTNRMAYN